jgi:hypothetical protein
MGCAAAMIAGKPDAQPINSMRRAFLKQPGPDHCYTRGKSVLRFGMDDVAEYGRP